jgi:hypothetical protein
MLGDKSFEALIEGSKLLLLHHGESKNVFGES